MRESRRPPSSATLLAVSFLVAAIPLLVTRAADPAEPEADTARMPVPLLLDTDIGGFVDDAFALAIAASDSRFELLGVTTVGGDSEQRAKIACRFLQAVGRRDVPVAWGRDPQPKTSLDGQARYARHPAVLFGRVRKPDDRSAVQLMYETLKARPREVTIVMIGPATNVARLLRDHPECRPWIKRIVMMGGKVASRSTSVPDPDPEWNVQQDITAAREVLESGVPLAMATAESGELQILTAGQVRTLVEMNTVASCQALTLFELSGNKAEEKLYDVVPLWHLAQAVETSTGRKVEIDRRGVTWVDDGPPTNAAILHNPGYLVPWVMECLRNSKGAGPPREPANTTTTVPRGMMPARVHVVEDYDSDIERRWWLEGNLDIFETAPGGRRSMRATPTMDFDDKMGDARATYRAVVFNPVPGPPMGKNTQLAFRYRVRGDFPLRIQLYSLSNGYHRYLTLNDLEQDRWTEATVDMTRMRRHDGSGGPLAEDERIDDIQFYIDPRADLWIDDILLYDAADEGERRPFPKRVVFTGWFDTGKQGAEWPGDFEIVKHQPPRGWKSAKSVPRGDGDDRHWLRVDMRGRRLLPPNTRLRFDYRIRGAEQAKVALVDAESSARHEVEFVPSGEDRWSEATVDFTLPDKATLRLADEIRFELPRGAEMWLDNLLLFQPGDP